jgi:predicted ATPase
VWSGEEHTHVGQRGDRAIDALLAGKDRRFNFAPNKRSKSFELLIAGRLKQMGLIHDFEVKPIAPGRKEYEVLLKTYSGMPTVKLTDVGVGVSQVLPVIVECFSVPARSIVIFEQPELHLHPKVQADLADLFVDAIRAREHGRPRNVQFIIESHSEHFLRRLQRRIAEGKLPQKDAALYFVDTYKGASRLRPLEVDPYGNILNWPKNFFGDEMGDLVARSQAQAKSMREAKQ